MSEANGNSKGTIADRSRLVQGGYTAPEGGERPIAPKTGSGVASAPQTSERFTGTIKWFDAKKGYGFINRPDGSDKDIFLHVNNLPAGTDELDEGQEVTYQTEASRKGVRAVNVIVVK